MNSRPDSDPEPLETPADEIPVRPVGLTDISIIDRWAPLVGNPENPAPVPPKLGRRVLASALCLIVLALFLWTLS